MQAGNKHFMSAVDLLTAKKSIEAALENLEADLPASAISNIRYAIVELVKTLERIANNRMA